MRTIIFDLDYTLFDARYFREDCLAPFFGVSIAKFEDSYQQNKLANKNFDYNQCLSEFERTEYDFDQFLEERINDYIFPDAEKLLRESRGRGYYLVLASFGNIQWQKKKISFLKIGKESFSEIFDEIILEDKDKSSNGELNKFQNSEVVIINDNDAESQKLLKLLGSKAKLYLLKGPYSASGFDNLKDLGSEIFSEE